MQLTYRQACVSLGISRPTLYAWLKKSGVVSRWKEGRRVLTPEQLKRLEACRVKGRNQ